MLGNSLDLFSSMFVCLREPFVTERGVKQSDGDGPWVEVDRDRSLRRR